MGLKKIGAGDIMNFSRFVVAEAGAGGYNETEIDTNLSAERSLIWFIRMIQLEILPQTVDLPAAGADESLFLQITRESKTAIINYNDADVIEKFTDTAVRSAAIGTDAGPQIDRRITPITIQYKPPIPYGSRSIFIGFQTTAAAPNTIRGRIGYTTEKVSERDFYRIAQSILG